MNPIVHVVNVDETPEPWEDYSYIYAVVVGTTTQVGKYKEALQSINPKWLITTSIPSTLGIKYLKEDN